MITFLRAKPPGLAVFMRESAPPERNRTFTAYVIINIRTRTLAWTARTRIAIVIILRIYLSLVSPACAFENRTFYVNQSTTGNRSVRAQYERLSQLLSCAVNIMNDGLLREKTPVSIVSTVSQYAQWQHTLWFSRSFHSNF